MAESLIESLELQALRRALADERAAREQDRKAWLASCAKLEDARDVLRLARATGSVPALVCAQFEACLDPEATPLAAAERERDAALARVKALETLVRVLLRVSGAEADVEAGRDAVEAMKSLRSDAIRDADACVILRDQLSTAETALASARELLSGWHGYVLSLRQGARCFSGQYDVGLILEDIIARVQTDEIELTSHPAPVAAPCAGCADWQKAAANWSSEEQRLQAQVKALATAIDATEAELERFNASGGTLASAFHALRSARKGGGA